MISYIVPVYNAANFLEPCVKSILGCMQSGDEIILVDDGSTDGSGSICDQLGRQHGCIRVEHLKNGGVSRARNRGMQRAKNEYIRFVDSDDEVLPVKAEPRSDLLVMDAEVLNERRQVLRKVSLDGEKTFAPKEMLETLSSAQKRCLLHYVWNHLYKREIIVKGNLRFDERVTLGEDFLFNCAYLSCCRSVEYLPAVCYRYFIRNSATESLTKKFHPDELERRRKLDAAFLELFHRAGCSEKSMVIAERLIGEIAVGSLEAVATKGKKVPADAIKRYMKGFYQTEYYQYLMAYFESCPKLGKSERLESILIRRKSCILLYHYLCARDKIRRNKDGG